MEIGSKNVSQHDVGVPCSRAHKFIRLVVFEHSVSLQNSHSSFFFCAPDFDFVGACSGGKYREASYLGRTKPVNSKVRVIDELSSRDGITHDQGQPAGIS